MRSLWSGSLSFGLINIPVRLYSAAQERPLSFKLLDKHHNCPISYVRVCKENHKEIPYEDIVKGYEYHKGEYVILDAKDFKKAASQKSEVIEIVQFANEKEIDPKYYEKPYYIEPEKRSAKAYALLRDALAGSQKVAIARYVFKEKEHIAAIKPEDKGLILHQLRYQDELRENTELHIPKEGTYSEEELDIAMSLVQQLTKKFDAKKFHDTYTEELKKIIESKAKGRKVKVEETKPVQTTEMKDLMKMLKLSLEKTPAKH